MKIRINSQEVEVTEKTLTYEQIVAMVYQATVVYCRGPKSKPEGILHTGQKVKVVEGMLIDCGMTNNA